MKRISKIILAGALTGFTLFGLSACGWHHGHDEDKMAERISSRVTRKLDLNTQQQANLDALIAQVQNSRKVITEYRDGNMTLLVTLLKADTLDQQSVIDLITGKTSAVESEAPAVVGALGTFTDTLNQEQREKLVERIEDKIDDHRRWRD